jgi:hypothetical protein
MGKEMPPGRWHFFFCSGSAFHISGCGWKWTGAGCCCRNGCGSFRPNGSGYFQTDWSCGRCWSVHDWCSSDWRTTAAESRRLCALMQSGRISSVKRRRVRLSFRPSGRSCGWIFCLVPSHSSYRRRSPCSRWPKRAVPPPGEKHHASRNLLRYAPPGASACPYKRTCPRVACSRLQLE